jgi:chemotaxis protein CheY-P-specific phosphatase CheC
MRWNPMAKLELTPDQRDGLQEIANIAVGQTADRVARGFSTFVRMPVPRVHLLEGADLRMALSAFDELEAITAVIQPFFAEGISGEALMLVTDAAAPELARLLGYQPSQDPRDQLEQMLEISSLLSASCVHGVLAQLEIDVLIGHPLVLGRQTNLRNIIAQPSLPWGEVLALELNYGFEGFDLSCDLVLVFHPVSLPALLAKLDLLLA